MSVASEEPVRENFVTSLKWKIQFGILCVMLLLALIGMGITQASAKSAWEYWLFVVIAYAALSLWRTLRTARQEGDSLVNLLGRQIAHWFVLIGFFALIILMERREIVSREAASDFSLAMLALACCLGGVHFDWLLMIVGVALTVMLIAMATLDQFAIVLWAVMILVMVAGAAFFYFKSKHGDSEAKPVE